MYPVFIAEHVLQYTLFAFPDSTATSPELHSMQSPGPVSSQVLHDESHDSQLAELAL